MARGGQLLNELGAEYDEVRYMRPPVPEGMEDWDRAKAAGTVSGLLPFSQVPALTHKWDGWTWPGPEPGYTEFSMVQSQAIMMYLARLYGLYGVDWHHAGRQGPAWSGVRSALARHGHSCGVSLADPCAEAECLVAAAAGDVSWLSSADSCRFCLDVEAQGLRPPISSWRPPAASAPTHVRR